MKRVIDDRLGHVEGHFEGRAWFRPDGEALAYHEEGQLQLGEVPSMASEQNHLWRAKAGRIFVAYGDGRAFHDFDPAQPDARHLCDPDEYRVRYDFSRWPDWTAVWVVSGPRKDYTMISHYSPASSGS